jgi:hypothetical protein
MAQSNNEDPPLLDVKITNPLTYIKKWWQRIIGNEGVDFSLRVRPLTAIAIALIVTSIAFGIGKIVLPFSIPFFKYNPEPISLPTSDPWRETALIGTLQFSIETGKFYLITSSSEAITLNVPNNIDLREFINRRIFAAGKYNKSTRTLLVAGASDLELLPKKPSPIPTNSPTSTPTPSTSPTPEPEIEITPTPQPTPSSGN